VPDSGVADQLATRSIPGGAKKLRHPRLGPVEYSHVVLQVADHPDQTLVTYSPATPPATPQPP
jgi:hypothetical protein